MDSGYPLRVKTLEIMAPDRLIQDASLQLCDGSMCKCFAPKVGRIPSFVGSWRVQVGLRLNVGHMAMGQKPVPPVNIPIPTKIGSKMGGASAPTNQDGIPKRFLTTTAISVSFGKLDPPPQIVVLLLVSLKEQKNKAPSSGGQAQCHHRHAAGGDHLSPVATSGPKFSADGRGHP